MEDSKQAIVEGEVEQALTLQRSLAEATDIMMSNPEFQAYLEQQKEDQAKLAALWKRVETVMIENDVKSFKGDWGSLSITESPRWETNEDLPAKFYKKVVDTTKINDTFKLEGKPIKGATRKTIKFLTKRLKGNQ